MVLPTCIMSIYRKSNPVKSLIKLGDICTTSSHIKYNVNVVCRPRAKVLSFFKKKSHETSTGYCPPIWHTEGNIKECTPGLFFSFTKRIDFNDVSLHGLVLVALLAQRVLVHEFVNEE